MKNSNFGTPIAPGSLNDWGAASDANCLNACSTPLFTGSSYPVGTIFAYNGGAGTYYPLYIRHS